MTRHIIYAGITTFVLALSSGCESERKSTSEPDRDRVATRYEVTRDEFLRDARARLAQMNARLDELEDKADVESQQAAARLRARRDDLSARIDRAEDVARSEWEEFKADVDRGLTELKTELDERF